MRHLLPSLRSNQEPRTEVVHLALTLRRQALQLPRKATPNQGTVGTTIRENALAAVTAAIGDLTLRPPLATPLLGSRRMATSPSPNATVDAATTSAFTAENLDMSTATVLATPYQPPTTPVVPERDPVLLLQPRPNQLTNATTNVAMATMAMGSLVKGILCESPSPSWLPTHQQNPQLMHPLHLAWETRR